MLVKFPGVESERTVSKFRKSKSKFLCRDYLFKKQVREIRKFHVTVVQLQLRNVQKHMMQVQSCYFDSVNLLLFCYSHCRYCRRSHLSSYCCDPEILLQW